MSSLSTPIGELRSRYGVVVVGSGYGGAIATYRMALAASEGGGPPAFSVCLLERGLEIRPGHYPSTVASALGQIQADTPRGHVGRRTALFDFRLNPDISVLVGCGLGGGSLINGSVMMRPTPEVLQDEAWPVALRSATALNREFLEVTKALGVARLPEPVRPGTRKVASLAEAGWATHQKTKRRWVPIAVSKRTYVDDVGVQHQRCILCGDCMSGCNHSAKNTLIMNYLPRAAAAGAAIFCGVDVHAIEPGQDGGWRLRVRTLDKASRQFGQPELTIEAAAVFLASGVLGSTEILLRSRHPLRMPLSNQLGKHFSSNGSAIAFAYNASTPVNGVGYGSHVPRNASVGPVIAGMLDERKKPSGAMIQEGAIPGALASIVRVAAPFMTRMTRPPGNAKPAFSVKHLWREVDSIIRGAHHGALLHTQTFLAMSRDSAEGEMRLRRNRLRISWPADGGPALNRVIERLVDLTKAMKGRYANPFWSRLFGRRLITVHPLGGCRMGDSACTGVVDDVGRVFKGPSGTDVHPNLFVCDGSVVPLALGTNPALTIGALAERVASAATRAVQGAAGQSDRGAEEGDADERPERINASIPGIRYAERLRGRFQLAGRTTRVELVLHLSAESIHDLLERDGHVLRIIGTARAPDLGNGQREFAISRGTLSVLVDDARQIDTKLLVYRMKLRSADGTVLWLLGYKTINLATLRQSIWRAISQFSFTLHDPSWKRVGEGTVRNSLADAIRTAASMEVTREPHRLRRARLLCRYGWFFVDALIQARVWAFARARQTNPFTRERLDTERREEGAGQVGKGLITDPRKRFLLTRHRDETYSGPKDPQRPPVVLAPGFGMSTLAFRLGHPSICDYLHAHGYQVWLFDYRGSDSLDVSLTQFTFDDLACRDFPEAVRRLSEHTGDKVVFLGHCAGALTVFMGMLEGKITGDHVRSVVLSQSFAFMRHPWLNRLKAHLRLPQLLEYLNFRPVMTADYDLRTGWGGRLLDRVLRFYPSQERCTNGVCRRLLLMWGDVFRHDQVDREMHDKVYDIFDRANLASLVHLGMMVREGRIVDSGGKDVYLTSEKAKNIRVPVTLLRSMKNTLFHPSGAKTTHEWLLRHGPFGPDGNAQMFELWDIDGYGHLDTFIGRDAETGTFPKILKALGRQPHPDGPS